MVMVCCLCVVERSGTINDSDKSRKLYCLNRLLITLSIVQVTEY